METQIPEGQKCEICHTLNAELMVDMNTDEESGPVMWYACAICAQDLHKD